jgi:serine/threonine-protein kinase HipA
MTSKKTGQAYVWVWLPGETEPIVAGKLEAENGLIHFNYGKSYLDRLATKCLPSRFMSQNYL